MSWDAAITALEAHMAAAAPGYSQRGGEPDAPATKTVAWYYEGTGDNEFIGETLTDHPFGERVAVRFYWPVATRDAIPSRTLELEIRSITRAFIARIEADRSLGEQVTVATPDDDIEAGWLSIGAQWWRIVTVPLTLGFTDEEPISR
jgi:hypothetical protein